MQSSHLCVNSSKLFLVNKDLDFVSLEIDVKWS